MIAVLANHLWQSTLFVAVIGVLALLLRKNGARLRYWLWMIASLKFVVPFSLLVSLGAQLGEQIEWRPHPVERPGIGASQDWTDFASSVVQPATNFTAPVTLPTPANPTPTWTVESILLTIWMLGVAAVLILWIYRWIQLQAVLRSAAPLSDATLGGFDFPAPIKQASGQIEPGIVGIVHPILLVPEGLFERLTRQQIGAILAHERCHLERRDNLTACVHMLIEAAFWFHPIVWWIGARLIEEREQACDAAVLKAGNDPETYASGILDVCQHYVAAPLDCVAGVSGADLKKRVRAIMTHRGEARVHFAKAALLASVSLAVVVSPIILGVLSAPRAEAIEPGFVAVPSNEWPKIDSTSIELSQADESSPNRSLLINPNGTFTTRNWSLRGVVAWAYGIQATEVSEPNARLTDLASNRYNIVAKSSELNISKKEEEREAQRRFLLLGRRLLDEQFKLRYHWETVRAPVYVLTVSEPNSGLKIAKPDDPGPVQGLGFSSLKGSAAPLMLLKQYCARILGRPIVDLTGLTERYNYTIKWGPEPGDPGTPSNGESPPTPKEPTKEQLIEALRTQLGLTLTSQDGEVQRMVIDHLEQPADLKPPPVEVKLAAEVFDRYVGYYAIPHSDSVMRIYRDGDKYFAQPTGQSALQFFAMSEREFFAKSLNARAAFRTDDTGNVAYLAVTQNGQESVGQRLRDEVATARIDALKARIRDKTPQPGSEALLRKYLQSLTDDDPAYSLMIDPVANAVRAEWPNVKARYAQLGRLKSIELKLVDPSGADVYTVTFENGRHEWRVGLNPSGKVDRLNYRRLQT